MYSDQVPVAIYYGKALCLEWSAYYITLPEHIKKEVTIIYVPEHKFNQAIQKKKLEDFSLEELMSIE